MRDTHIADRLRNAGLNVIEVADWRERGSDTFNPVGSVDHHTGGSASGNAPSLNICINGRSDLPGPLCNVLVGRNNDCYVIAAGRANHAGKGEWAGHSGNSSVYGVERENVGTKAEPWRSDQTDAAARVHAALIRGTGHPDPALCCEHKEWAPTRKVDAHTITGDDMRARITNALHFPTPGDDDMFTDADRATLDATRAATAQLVNADGRLVDLLNAIKAAVDSDDDGGPGQISPETIDKIADAVVAEIAS